MMFITFEGIDASGKTTQLQLLAKALTEDGFDLIITRQPGGTKIGTQIREILLNPEHQELNATTEVLLYMADRIQHISEVIKPALQQNKIVLCDRYHDATLAYQGGGRQLDLTWLDPLTEQSVQEPDLTFWFDLPISCSRQRLLIRNQQQGAEDCRIESEKNDFFQRVRDRYRRLCRNNSARYVKLDASLEIDVIKSQIYKTTTDLITQKSGTLN